MSFLHRYGGGEWPIAVGFVRNGPGNFHMNGGCGIVLSRVVFVEAARRIASGDCAFVGAQFRRRCALVADVRRSRHRRAWFCFVSGASDTSITDCILKIGALIVHSDRFVPEAPNVLEYSEDGIPFPNKMDAVFLCASASRPTFAAVPCRA